MEVNSRNVLQGCVSSMRTSMELLESSINVLDVGVSDYPRLVRVLQTTKHFELIAERDLVAAQASLLSEIQPEVQNLLLRVEAYLDKLERREQSLIAKADLNEGRLSRAPRQSTGRATSTEDGQSAESSSQALTALQQARLQQMRQKKERLSYAVSRLELQAGQRERQLRKSMAAQ